MASFYDAAERAGKNILKRFRNLDLKYNEDQLNALKNSYSIGKTQSQIGYFDQNDKSMLYALSMSDLTNARDDNNLAIFNNQYQGLREYLLDFASNPEIQNILDILTTDCIVYDDYDSNKCCDVKIRKELIDSLADNNKLTEEIIKYIEDTFNYLYYKCYRFNSPITLVNILKEYLITGYLAYEIIWDDTQESVIGFKELDPLTLRRDTPIIKTKAGKEEVLKRWIQFPDGMRETQREMSDSQIIYMSYSDSSYSKKISYCETLRRSFNLLRLIEDSRVVWNIQNASYRMKMVFPIGDLGSAQAKQDLSEMIARYKEDIRINPDGEISVNGTTQLQYYKNYVLPSKNGESPEIEPIGGEGPELVDTDLLEYFRRKLIKDSKIPASRFDVDSSSMYETSASVEREEIRYENFLSKIRGELSNLLLKPLKLMVLNKYDIDVDGFVNIIWNSDSNFKIHKQIDMLDQVSNLYDTLKEMTDNNDKKIFSSVFLKHKLFPFSNEEWQYNDKLLEEENNEEGDDGGDDGGDEDRFGGFGRRFDRGGEEEEFNEPEPPMEEPEPEPTEEPSEPNVESELAQAEATTETPSVPETTSEE